MDLRVYGRDEGRQNSFFSVEETVFKKKSQIRQFTMPFPALISNSRHPGGVTKRDQGWYIARTFKRGLGLIQIGK